MIDGWDKGPRDRGDMRTAVEIHRSADWIYRLGPQVAIEVRNLNEAKRGAPNRGVLYADLCIGEGASAHRLQLGPVLYWSDAPESERMPLSVPTVEDAMKIEEQRGREAARFILLELSKVKGSQ